MCWGLCAPGRSVMFTWLYDFWTWVATPGVRPFFGAIAAVLAAMTIQPGTWFSPLRALRRAFQIIVVWLVLAWLFGMIPAANGEGFGWQGGRGQGGIGKDR